MNSFTSQMKDSRQQTEVHSFFEPAQHLLNQIIDHKKKNLRSKGYDENNAAVTKVEFTEIMARQFRITQWMAQQIVGGLIKAECVQAFGGYVKPKAGDL